MLQNLAALSVLGEGVPLDDGSIGNDRVNVSHALRLGLFHGIEGGVFDRGVVFDDDEFASGAFREVEEGLGGGVVGVTVGGDDGL